MLLPQLSSFLDASYFLPLHCLGCGMPHFRPLCRDCNQGLESLDAPIRLPFATWSIYTPWLGSPIGYQVFKHWKTTGSSRLETRLFDLKAGLIEEMKLQAFTAIVPVPQNLGRSWRRGFESAKRSASFFSKQLELPVLELLTLREPDSVLKQSMRNRFSREFSPNPFVLNTRTLYPNGIPTRELENILLVDDLITTGMTLLNAKDALKPLAKNAERIHAAAIMYKPAVSETKDSNSRSHRA